MPSTHRREHVSRLPARPRMFVVGMVFLIAGLLGLVASAFVDSRLVNVLTAALLPGTFLAAYGWFGHATT